MSAVIEVTDESPPAQNLLKITGLKSKAEISNYQLYNEKKKMKNRNESKKLAVVESVESSKTSTRGRRSNKLKEEEEILIYGARHSLKLFVPVSLSMALVVTTINSIMYYRDTDVYFIYTPFHEDTDDPGTKLWQSMANASIMLCLIATMTFVLLILYKFQCYKIINGWLVVSSVMLLFFFSYIYLEQVLLAYNVPMDYITTAIIMWNFGIGGLFCIHWKGPLLLQQAYLIMISALVSLMFIKHLPDWTTWSVLSVLVIWDLIAVLCPRGPLKMLIETAETRSEPVFPALIYSTVLYIVAVMANVDQTEQQLKQDETTTTEERGSMDKDKTVGSKEVINFDIDELEKNIVNDKSMPQEPCPDCKVQSPPIAVKVSGDVIQAERSAKKKVYITLPEPSVSTVQQLKEVGTSVDPEIYIPAKKVFKKHSQKARKIHFTAIEKPETVTIEEERGIKLGLGDFIFYGVLVGKASTKGDWNTTLACFVAVLIGLCCTLLLLAITRTALPALPISLTFGLLFSFITSTVVQPFMDSLASEQVYI